MHPAHCFLAVFAFAAHGVMAATPASPDFTSVVRPILSRHCFKCHGPDDAARKSGLRLDQQAAATHPAKSGATAVVAGNPSQSELIRRISATSPDDLMPPPESKNPLTETEKDLLKTWVSSGAEYVDLTTTK